MEIEVFADIWCPFTHVSLRKVAAARSEGRFDAVMRVRAWPLELVNGVPLSPSHVAEEIEELRAHVDPAAFAGFDQGRFPQTTLPALRLTALAYDRGAPVGEAVALGLRDRLFERGQDVSDSAVLAAVAAEHGLDLAAEPSSPPEADWEEGKRRGVSGSPHFFTPSGGFFCPSMEIEKVEGHLHVRSDAAGFDRFLASIGGRGAPES